MSPCPVCGGDRLPIEQTSRYTVWICHTCGIGREDVVDGVQESFERREHP